MLLRVDAQKPEKIGHGLAFTREALGHFDCIPFLCHHRFWICSQEGGMTKGHPRRYRVTASLNTHSCLDTVPDLAPLSLAISLGYEYCIHDRIRTSKRSLRKRLSILLLQHADDNELMRRLKQGMPRYIAKTLADNIFRFSSLFQAVHKAVKYKNVSVQLVAGSYFLFHKCFKANDLANFIYIFFIPLL